MNSELKNGGDLLQQFASYRLASPARSHKIPELVSTEKATTPVQADDEFTEGGLWTPQTFMLQAIKRWINGNAF